eukprot:TRINITY_DN287_c0_g1_i3.p1 TRINITY_DN287_c0_g1~~TRINITY_DN287_c0_g1_i3.p1  ORF type:complete len:107 (+),score=17.99 TRINITY_DN287_c0_g1_i3:64-384(+)
MELVENETQDASCLDSVDRKRSAPTSPAVEREEKRPRLALGDDSQTSDGKAQSPPNQGTEERIRRRPRKFRCNITPAGSPMGLTNSLSDGAKGGLDSDDDCDFDFQ